MTEAEKRSRERQALGAVLRTDFASFLRKVFHTLVPGERFIPEWYIDAIAHRLEQVRRGEIRRLIINMPPRSLKSIAASVAFPAFLLGHNPAAKIIGASYGRELSEKHSNDTRLILHSDWYRQVFPAVRIGSKDTQSEIQLTGRGFRLATSVGGVLTGRGGDIVLIDDPLKPADALSEPMRNEANNWFINTLLSRLDNKKTGAIVLVMQRLHLDDLTGFVLRLGGEEWTVLNLPAIAEVAETIPLTHGRLHNREIGDVLSPAREPLKVLEALRRQLGSDLFSAQYQQAPVPPGGAMIKRSWVARYKVLPPAGQNMGTIQSWDTAMKGSPDNDWSVCTTWLRCQDQRWYLLDVWRDRVDYPTLKATVLQLANLWRPYQVLIEEAGTAVGLLQELRYSVRGLTGVRPDRDKQSRMSMISAQFEAGQVFLPEEANWLPELEAELFSFPGGRHDDQVDSISQALLHAKDGAAIWALLAE